MDWLSTELLIGVATLFLAFYYYSTSTFDFWRKRGVSGPKPSPLFGNFKDVMFNKIFVGDYLKNEYNNFKNEPMFGIFNRKTPILILKDPDLIKDVLIKDFTIFSDRGFVINEKVEPLSQHLFFFETNRWRPLRKKLSPVFTSGKLKEMFYLLVDCANHFEQFLDSYTKKHSIIECRELTAKFTTDVIGVCAFGLKMNAIAEEDSQFRVIGRKVFEFSLRRLLRQKLRETAFWLADILAPFIYDYEVNDFFINTMKQTIEYRKKNNIKKNDIVDLLMEIKDNPQIGDFEMTDILITAQAFVFFIAGFETSSTTMSNALYELALNQSIQNELRAEINNELNKNNGEIKYESIKNMQYLHKVFCETLRKYSPGPILIRHSQENYTFTGTKVSIPKGITVWIPVHAIHRDSDIYPDPDTFDPERFDEENAKSRHPSYYLPFGEGPRNCIGARFANYQSKVGLIKIIKNYKVEVCDETCIPYINNPKSPLIQPIGGIKLRFTKIK